MFDEKTVEILRAPFALNEIDWLPCKGGLGRSKDGRTWLKILPYITARAAMNRLNKALGVGGWSTMIRPIEMKKTGKKGITDIPGIICTLRIGDCIHEDVAELTDVEDLKGGASGALKRVVVHIGVAAYLYDLEDVYAEIYDRGHYRHQGDETKGIKPFRWSPPDEGWFRKNAPWMLPQEVLNPQVIRKPEMDDEADDAPAEIKEEIKWPDNIAADSRRRIEEAALPTIKSWYARKALEIKGSAAWDPTWTREEAINAYIKISGKKATA